MRSKLGCFILAVTVALSSLLGGCGCNTASPLSFPNGNAFNGGVAPIYPFKEKLTYSVEYNADGVYKKAAVLDGLLNFSIENGEYVSELSVLNSAPDIDSSVIEKISEQGSPVYKLTTDFTVLVTVSYGGEEKTHTDTIKTLCYFADVHSSFAPIYSKTEAEYVILQANSTDVFASVFSYEYTATYDTDKYYTSYISSAFALGETPKETELTPETAETDYSYRTAIDNAQLLFALRGITLDEKSSFSMPVVSSGYKTPTTLKITNTGNKEDTVEINYNGETYSEKMNYFTAAMIIDSSDNSGSTQYFGVQTKESEHIPNRALILTYDKQLTVFGTYASLGTLSFRLNSVEING